MSRGVATPERPAFAFAFSLRAGTPVGLRGAGCAGIPGTGRGTAQAAIFLSMWSMTSECSFCGLNRMTSASAPTFTVCPGGQ